MSRYVTAAILIPVAILLIVYYPMALALALVALSIIAQHEMSKAMAATGAKPVRFLLYTYPVAMFAAWWFTGGGAQGLLATFGVLVLYAIGALSTRVLRPDMPHPRTESTLMSLLYPGIPMFALSTIAALGLNQSALDPGNQNLARALLFILIGTVCVGDASAMFGGMLLGKKSKKLAPSISPKKTVVGFACELVMAPLAAMFFCWISRMFFTPTFSFLDAAIMGVAIAPLAVLGDLIASTYKRAAGIKDYSNLFPGHGGVLDRFDAMSLSAVFVLIYTVARGWI